MQDTLCTYYASAQRSPREEILRQHELLMRHASQTLFLDQIATMVAVLNSNRQIVYANRHMLDAVGAADSSAVIGKRVGELFGCVHAFEVNGCGTSKKCAACGAVKTMVSALAAPRADRFIEECCLINDQTTLDLRVCSSPARIEGETFIVCSIFDIGDEKRRAVMERIFFHDILNSVNNIGCLSQLMVRSEDPDGGMGFMLAQLDGMVNALGEEIHSHRLLTLAEKGNYEPESAEIQTLDMLRAEVMKYNQAALLESKNVRIDPSSENTGIMTDWPLLSRVLGNMLKNAIEAEPPETDIAAGVRREGEDKVMFWVHNPSVIPPKIALQIFERSFSTKGESRGLGTHSMKLLTERYLGGTIGFTSEPGQGTTFRVVLPVHSASKSN